MKHNGRFREAFEAKILVRKGHALSPMIFLSVVDWTMQQTVGNKKIGTRWTDEKKIVGLDFSDDSCLMSYKLEGLYEKTNKLAEVAKTGLQVNKGGREVVKTTNLQP
uniref:Reverse transcriptase domain-containing protein n=1 Tax=Trichobilharzia regenti TaxID=157069 RepID=A0AA85JPR3_TRIRE|nr:unnamed protein product [Trichobilharzia regenti]